jgi:carbon storage regulator CsrA
MSNENGRQMLVLGRKKGERIRINDTVEVVVLDIQQGCVQFGIDTPRAPPIRPGRSCRKPR